MRWSKKDSEFQYLSNNKRIAWTNFESEDVTMTNCKRDDGGSCRDGDGVYLSTKTDKWKVDDLEWSRFILCETTLYDDNQDMIVLNKR